MVRAVAVMITGGFYLQVSQSSFQVPGREGVGSLTYSVIIWGVVAAIMWVVLSGTPFGRYVHAVGGNFEAARLSGVRVNVVRVATFAISGFAAGLAGVLQASQISQGDSGQGVGMELDAIAAVVLGGTSILGGEGAIWRTLLGAGLLALIHNGCNLLNMSQSYQDLLTGALILTAIALNALAARDRS
jgi:ribose transport system permease protein